MAARFPQVNPDRPPIGPLALSAEAPSQRIGHLFPRWTQSLMRLVGRSVVVWVWWKAVFSEMWRKKQCVLHSRRDRVSTSSPREYVNVLQTWDQEGALDT